MDLALSAVIAAVGAAGTFWWLKAHSHPDLVTRSEFDLLRGLIESHHAQVMRELDQIRERL